MLPSFKADGEFLNVSGLIFGKQPLAGPRQTSYQACTCIIQPSHRGFGHKSISLKLKVLLFILRPLFVNFLSKRCANTKESRLRERLCTHKKKLMEVFHAQSSMLTIMQLGCRDSYQVLGSPTAATRAKISTTYQQPTSGVKIFIE